MKTKTRPSPLQGDIAEKLISMECWPMQSSLLKNYMAGYGLVEWLKDIPSNIVEYGRADSLEIWDIPEVYEDILQCAIYIENFRLEDMGTEHSTKDLIHRIDIIKSLIGMEDIRRCGVIDIKYHKKQNVFDMRLLEIVSLINWEDEEVDGKRVGNPYKSTEKKPSKPFIYYYNELQKGE